MQLKLPQSHPLALLSPPCHSTTRGAFAKQVCLAHAPIIAHCLSCCTTRARALGPRCAKSETHGGQAPSVTRLIIGVKFAGEGDLRSARRGEFKNDAQLGRRGAPTRKASFYPHFAPQGGPAPEPIWGLLKRTPRLPLRLQAPQKRRCKGRIGGGL